MSDKYAALREEVSTVGSKYHLRKLALQLLDELAERDADRARIAELESRKVKLDRPKIGKLHGALIHVWSAYDVQTAIELAGISLKIEGE